MNCRRNILGLSSAVGLLILILDGKTALAGASAGIELCLRTVIPALFPFFVFSSVIIQNPLPRVFQSKTFRSIFKMPKGMESLLLPSFLGGYPVGAQSVYQAYKSCRLTKADAERLLAFCSNAGPAFLFGMVGQMFPKRWMSWSLWGIHIAGALAAAQCIARTDAAANSSEQLLPPAENLMAKSVATMGIVCGWIVLFRVLIAFLDRWFLWLLPQTVRVALIGMLELSNGCCELSQIPSVPIRFILCSGMLAAGGLCVTAQTVSVTKGLSLDHYWWGKLIQITVSLILSFSLMNKSALPLLFLLPMFLYRKSKKRDRNRVVSGV